MSSTGGTSPRPGPTLPRLRMQALPARSPLRSPSVRMPGPWSPPMIAVWVFCVCLTAVLLWSPYVAFGYHNGSLHIVLDSVDACIALLVAHLMHNRFRRDGRLQDWLLAQGLLLLAVAGLGLGFAIEEMMGIRDGALNVWLPLSVRVTGALLVLAGCLSGDRRVSTRLRRWSLAVPALAVTVAVIVFWSIRDRLPLALDHRLLVDSAFPVLAGHPLLLIGQGASATCFFVASVVVAAQAARRDDELLRWLAPACTLAAFARLHYLLYPSLYTDWLYTGDVLRTGCYLLMLVGALRELQQYWSGQTRAAVLEDRRRLARELHDGVIQELAYIRSETHSIPAGMPPRSHIADASDRALDEARAAVDALGRVGDEPLGFVLHRAAAELAERHHVDLDVDLDDSIHVAQEQRHALMRITREAVSNAVRHGKARQVRIRLQREGTLRRLTIEDDGAGFDPRSASAGSGYGLTSMRDRAKALPGSVHIDSSPGQGCVVTVRW